MASHFNKMVSLARTQDDKDRHRERMEELLNASPDGMEFPPGCCICLTEEVLEKLGIDEVPEKGDRIHLCLEAEVTSVSDDKLGRRIELQVTDMMAAENETTESEEMMDDARAEKRYGKDAA